MDAAGQAASLGPWAGVYEVPPGATWTSLELSDDGFHFQVGGCLGFFTDRTGVVRIEGSRLVLLADAPGDLRSAGILGPELDLVRWGERRYVIPIEAAATFCHAVNSGREARPSGSAFLLQRGGERARPQGLPEVPAAWRERLLATPIETRIVALEPEVRIDCGGNAGVIPGLRFYTRSGDVLEVVEADASRSLVAPLQGVAGSTPAELRVGEPLSTRETAASR